MLKQILNQLQWALLNGIPLGSGQSDSINRITLWLTDCTKAQIGLGYLRQIDPINQMIPLTVIPLSGLNLATLN